MFMVSAHLGDPLDNGSRNLTALPGQVSTVLFWRPRIKCPTGPFNKMRLGTVARQPPVEFGVSVGTGKRGQLNPSPWRPICETGWGPFQGRAEA